MSAHVDTVPSRTDVITRLRALIAETMSRQEVASWASAWLRGDPQVDDQGVWNALNSLAMADLISTDRPYLYGREDFEAWLSDLLK
jgi:hypothetical protein